MRGYGREPCLEGGDEMRDLRVRYGSGIRRLFGVYGLYYFFAEAAEGGRNCEDAEGRVGSGVENLFRRKCSLYSQAPFVDRTWVSATRGDRLV